MTANFTSTLASATVQSAAARYYQNAVETG